MHGSIGQLSQRLRIIFGAFIGLTAILASTAQAQSLSPLTQKVVSFSEVFLVQFQVTNTYDSAQVSRIRLYSSDWKPLEPRYVSRKSARLGAHDSVIVTAMVPFSGQTNRIVYVCNSILPRINGVGSAYRGEVCGKVYATQLQE